MLGVWLGRGVLVLSALAVPASPARRVAEAPEWMVITPGGDTGCGLDTPFEFWVREGDPTQVLIYLQGGGACWNHETCHPERRIRFRRQVDSTDHLERQDGVFDRSSPANPFRRHTMIFVPYCTGDFHLGARRVTYAAPPGDEAGEVTVNHVGYHNVRSVLRYLARRSPEPGMVVVTGGSAGAIASPFVAAEVARLLPRAAIRQIGDGAGGLRVPQVRALLGGWGVDSLLAARGLPLASDGDALTGMYLTAGARHPRVRFAQINTSEDATVADGLRLFGQGPERVAANIAETYGEMGTAGICFSGYVVPGAQHTLLWRPEFLTASVAGRALADVLAREVLDRPCPEDEADDPGREAAAALARAAADFLASLTDGQRAVARFAFEDGARTRWSYTPVERPGLALKAMRPAERALAHELLRTLLSHAGFLKVHAIMGLESYLRMVERGGLPRDPEAYVIAVFGTPDASARWGFRFEGHHVSVNFTWVGAQAAAVTPFFLGANPAAVPTGPQAGLRALALEEEYARALLRSFSDEQLRVAVVTDTAPPDIFTTNAQVAEALDPVGLRMSDMTPAQQSGLLRLIEVYVGNLNPALAGREWSRVVELDPATLRFAWFGSREPEGPHYYRIQGETFLIEYDHVFNHVHTVWRDLERDFGRDLLREHHQGVPHRHGRRDP